MENQKRTAFCLSRAFISGRSDLNKQTKLSGYVQEALFVLIFSAALTCGGFAAESTEQKTVLDLKIQSIILNEERTFSVQLPDGYEQSEAFFPVLYTLDAEHKPGFSMHCSTVSRLAGQGEMPPVIMIGIWNAPGMRNRDMIPVPVSHRPGSGGAHLFLRFIKEELIPLIKKRYRASDEYFLYGASNAGLFAVYAILEEPDLFKAGIAASPMIGHCPDFMDRLANGFTNRYLKGERILYMIYGTEDSPRVTDFVPSFQKYIENNFSEDLISRSVVLDGEGHVPSSSLEKGLRFIFSDDHS